MNDVLIVLAVALAAFVLWIVWLARRNSRFFAEIEEGLGPKVEEHQSTLGRKRRETVSYDDYGTPDTEKWNAEIQYFLERVILPGLSRKQQSILASSPQLMAALVARVEDQVRGAEGRERAE